MQRREAGRREKRGRNGTREILGRGRERELGGGGGGETRGDGKDAREGEREGGIDGNKELVGDWERERVCVWRGVGGGGEMVGKRLRDEEEGEG